MRSDPLAVDFFDPAKYHRLFARMCDNRYELTFFEEAGGVWTRNELFLPFLREAQVFVCRAKSKAEKQGGDILDKEGGCLQIPSGTSLFYQEISGPEDNAVGYIAAIPATASLTIDALEVAKIQVDLKEIAIAIQSEIELNDELNSMSGECAERYEELHLVYEIGEKIIGTGNKGQIFEELTKLCVDYLSVDMAVFIRGDSKELVYAVDPLCHIYHLEPMLKELKETVFQYICSSKKTLILLNIHDKKRAHLFNNFPYKILGIPILTRDQRVKGTLMILRHWRKPHFVNSDKSLLRSISEQFNVLIKNHEMYDELKVFTDQIVFSLVASIDAKDPYTRGHSDRVNLYSLEIGEELGLSKEEIWTLNWSSRLHDIGKIGTPDGVLTKPGKLTDEEYALIHMHPEMGYEILRPVTRLEAAIPGVRHHHERFDGKGFPHGLTGKAIPLQARIISIADTYDAITSTRAYRSARTHEEAMAEIERVSGTQLDKQIVEVWKKIAGKRKNNFFPDGL